MHYERIPSMKECERFFKKTKDIFLVKNNSEWSSDKVRERFKEASDKWLKVAFKDKISYQERFTESWLFLNEYMRCLALNKYGSLFNTGKEIVDGITKLIEIANPFQILNIFQNIFNIKNNYEEMKQDRDLINGIYQLLVENKYNYYVCYSIFIVIMNIQNTLIFLLFFLITTTFIYASSRCKDHCNLSLVYIII